ncbi:class I adenylate-forming enzyme family protein [Tabrizicola sp.]|uniref:class I adenylate-forming enzyme family protein n=1 Tax=Tabrizicola sp. TaxID=2005166 RepID=UPI0035B10A5A
MDQTRSGNLGLHYLRAVARFPQVLAVTGAGLSVTHGQLAEASLALALGLHERGMGQGSTVAVRTADPVISLASLMATALIGARWVFGHGNLLGTDRLAIDLTLDDATMEPASLPITPLDATWFAPRSVTPGSALPFAGFRSDDDIWMISQTSGTTGTPKLVGLPHRVVVDRIAANARRLDWRGLRMASLFPVSAPVWLTYALTALLHAGSVRFGRDAEAWFGDGVGYALASPAQAASGLQGLCAPGKVAILQLSGGPAAESLVRDLLSSFAEVWVGYGSTEGFNALTNIRTLRADGSIASRTVLAPGSRVEVVAADGSPVPAGQEGEIRVTNTYLAPGYLNAPEATAASFRAGSFHPGDLGLWDAEGNFHITGRVNDQFNLGGQKVNAQLLDFTLLGVEGVRDAISFILPDLPGTEGLRAFLSVEPGADMSRLLAEARIALLALGGESVVPRRFLFADTLPRNQNGKADRRACVRMVEEGKFRRQERAAQADEAHL